MPTITPSTMPIASDADVHLGLAADRVTEVRGHCRDVRASCQHPDAVTVLEAGLRVGDDVEVAASQTSDDGGQPIRQVELPNPLSHHLASGDEHAAVVELRTVACYLGGAGGSENVRGVPERPLVADHRDDVSVRKQRIRSGDVHTPSGSDAADHEGRITVPVHHLADRVSDHCRVLDDEIGDRQLRCFGRRFERDAPPPPDEVEADECSDDAHGIGDAVRQHRQVREGLDVLGWNARLRCALTDTFLHRRQRGRVGERAAVQPGRHRRTQAEQAGRERMSRSPPRIKTPAARAFSR